LVQSDVTLVASYEDEYTRIGLRADGLLCFYAAPGMVLTLERAQCLLRAGLTLIGGQPRPTFVHMQEVARVDREARAYFASDEYLTLSSQTALIVGSPVSRVIGNFFVGLNRPKYPIRLFNEEAPAIAWLKGYVQ
jgi:hypothetical protein